MKSVKSTLCLLALAFLCGCGGGEGAGEGSTGRGAGGGAEGSGNPPPQGQAYTVLYTFKNRADGKHPVAGLTRDAAGNLYGTTYTGGISDCGTVFKLDAAGKNTVLYSFAGGLSGPDAALPSGVLVRDAAGNLYGTTVVGGMSGYGSVFKVDAAGKETVLYSFTNADGGPDGPYPTALIRDEAGNLYGTTQVGGTFGSGIVFKLDTAGHYQILHSFTSDFSGPNGAYPSGLIRDADGNLYGTTYQGGAFGRGTVFMLDAAGTETVLYNFAGMFFGPDDGEGPSGLIRDEAGNFYGVTTFGGASNNGTIFKLDMTGNETVLHSFTGPDGVYPSGRLTRDAAGNLYGTTSGGPSNWGVIFRLNVESGVYTVMHAFTGKSDGGGPNGTLIADNARNLYGTTFGGGNLTACPPSHDQDLPSTPGCGVVFRIKLP